MSWAGGGVGSSTSVPLGSTASYKGVKNTALIYSRNEIRRNSFQ